MSSFRSVCHTVHLASLGIWVGAVAMSAVTAAIAFPAMKQLGVQVPGLAPGAEADQYRFAAGAVAQPTFLASDIVAFVCATLSAATLIALIAVYKVPPKRPATMVRSLALGVALACLAASLIIVTPQIVSASKLHLAAAKAGDTVAAATHKKAVDDLHPMSRNLILGELLGALVALVAGGWSLAQSPSSVTAAPADPYPEPALRRRAAKP